tara:strand:- start:60 stop:275 length:216 start_codon:yes stop_codon:yes gene_type:complete
MDAREKYIQQKHIEIDKLTSKNINLRQALSRAIELLEEVPEKIINFYTGKTNILEPWAHEIEKLKELVKVS